MMVAVAGIVGVAIGFAVGLLFGEVILSDQGDWTNVLPWVLAVVGWLAGAGFARQFRRSAS